MAWFWFVKDFLLLRMENPPKTYNRQFVIDGIQKAYAVVL